MFQADQSPEQTQTCNAAALGELEAINRLREMDYEKFLLALEEPEDDDKGKVSETGDGSQSGLV